MEPAPVLTVVDLRRRAIMNWVQDVKLEVPFGDGPPIEVALHDRSVLPVALFEYQLSKALYQGTAAGGVKWWLKERMVPVGPLRQHGFGISIRYECRHSRKSHRKREVEGSKHRNSKHVACVECPVFVRFKGSVVKDCSTTAVVLTAKFVRSNTEPLKTLRKEFPALNCCKYAEILASNKFAFVFENCCMAEDALALQGQVHQLFTGTTRPHPRSCQHH